MKSNDNNEMECIEMKRNQCQWKNIMNCTKNQWYDMIWYGMKWTEKKRNDMKSNEMKTNKMN